MQYVIVVGGGAVGYTVAKMLENEGYAVTIIEKDRNRAEFLLQDTHCHVIIGDATNPWVLESAEIKKASYLIAVTGDDKTNVISSILAKHYGVENIITRIVDPAFHEICKKLGIPNIVNPAETIAIQIDALIRGIKFVDFVKISREDVDVEEVNIRKDNFAGKPLSYVKEVSKDIVYPLMVLRGDKVLVPSDDLKLTEGDKLLILRKRRKLFF
jgi:trk system potassium uptake protein TrkA